MGARLLYGWNVAAAEWLPMAVDATGRLRISPTPRSSMRVERVAPNQSIPSGANTLIQFNNVIYDVLGEWNPATFLFTATIAGKYIVTAGMYMAPAVAARIYQLSIARNVPQIGAMRQHSSVALEMAMTVSAPTDLAVGDIVWAAAFHTSGVARDIVANPINFLAVERVG